MATGSVPSVVIELDRPRRMTLTLGALRRIREATGKGLGEIEAASAEEATEHLGAYLWAAMAGEDPDLTLVAVEEMIHLGNIEYASERLNELIALSMPGSDPLDSPAPKKPAAKRVPAKAKGKKPAA